MKKLILIALIGTVLISCRKDEIDNTDGPNLTDVYGEFAVLETLDVSQLNADFSAGQNPFFTCKMSKIINWELTITGQTSGAKKTIEGTSNELNASNSSWNGSTTELPIFRAEACDVILTFDGEPDTLFAAITVDQAKTNAGFLIADFETGWLSGWTSFIQSGAQMDFNVKTDGTAPENDAYYNLQGEVDWDYLVGLVDFNASAYGGVTLPLTSNSDNLWFNAMVYGDAAFQNTIMLFRFDEDENEDGSFNATNEDQYSYEFNVDWVGWRLVSIKYADLVGNPAGGGVLNPDKLNKVSMLHLADPVSGLAKSKLDYLIFTENGPLQP